MVGIVPSQDFCPWAGIATKLSSGPGALLDRPRISAPGQALRLEERKRVQHLHAVPGFLPLGRHCDPRSLRHCDTLTCVLGPRISAPGQTLRLFRRRRVGATFGLDSPRISAPGQALRLGGRPRQRLDISRPRISAPGQALRRGGRDLGRADAVGSQDFCPWAGIATRRAYEEMSIEELVPGFLPLGRHCDGYHRSAFIFGRLYRSLRASLSVRITPPMGLSEVPDFTDTSSGMTSGTTWPLATRFSMLTTLFPS